MTSTAVLARPFTQRRCCVRRTTDVAALVALAPSMLLAAFAATASVSDTPPYTGHAEGDGNTQGRQQAYDNGPKARSDSAWAGEPLIVGNNNSQGETTSSCNSNDAGIIRWTGSQLQYCNGTCFVRVGSTPGTTGLVGYWKLDDGSGTIAADSVTGGTKGITHGNPSWTPGKVDGSLNLNGSDQYVDVVPSAQLNITSNQVTLAAWINANSTAEMQRIITMPRSDTAGTEDYSLVLSNDTVAMHAATTGAPNIVSTTFSLTESWHHIVGVWDGIFLYLYLDGALKKATLGNSGSGNLIGNASGNFRIGSFSSSFPQYFNGRVDDVRVYDRALSMQDVLDLYNVTAGGCAY